MAKHARIRTDEQRERLEHNRLVLLDALAGTSGEPRSSTQTAGMTLVLERFVVNRSLRQPLPFEGARGVERLLDELGRIYVDGRELREGRLVGVAGMLAIEGHSEPVSLDAHVGAGGQLCLEIGPATELAVLSDALAVFSRQLHVAAETLGRDVELVAQGYNPYVSSPSDVVLVPGSHYALVNAYLARTGTGGRAWMRCTAATRLKLPMPPQDEVGASYRLLAALSPVLAFLTDNTLRMDGGRPKDTPRMARALVAEHVDPRRCGFAEPMLRPSAGIETYERWLEGLRPIVLTSADGVTFSTGTDTLEQVMCERELTPQEARQLAAMAWPWVGICGQLELSCADSLPPRLALSYAALVKGIMASATTRAAAAQLVGLQDLDAEAITQAWQVLRNEGWNARVYGRPIGQIADELVALAARGLDDPHERRQLDALGQLWEVRCVPRDLLLSTWERHRPRTREEEAAERWGAGAVIPYDELQGDPPAGSTAVMRLDKLRGHNG